MEREVVRHSEECPWVKAGIKVVCCYCGAFLRGDKNSTTISHGSCVPCARQAIDDLERSTDEIES